MGMGISQGTWIVVRRQVRYESQQRGVIVASGRTEKVARQLAEEFRKLNDKHDYWAMDKKDY